ADAARQHAQASAEAAKAELGKLGGGSGSGTGSGSGHGAGHTDTAAQQAADQAQRNAEAHARQVADEARRNLTGGSIPGLPDHAPKTDSIKPYEASLGTSKPSTLSSFLGGGGSGSGLGAGKVAAPGVSLTSEGVGSLSPREQGLTTPGRGLTTTGGPVVPGRGAVGGIGENGAPMMPPMGGAGAGGAGQQQKERDRTTWLQGDDKDWEEDETGVSSPTIGRS
ncbi:MAG: hypothetical protein QOF58_1782, partial [Pseudonocardiales bacterium]|nr:hypothetical protein [Pseudonocardiales bacterium]